jgi:hypothetical protein
MGSGWPKTLQEAVKICLLTLTSQEKEAVKNTPKKDLIRFHVDLAMRIRNEFGMWEGNDELIRSCGAFERDDAFMTIMKEVWKELTGVPTDTI